MRPTNVRASVGSSRSGSSASATVIVPPAFAVAWFVLLPVLLLPHPAATSAATTPATAKLNVRRMLTLLPERDGPPTRHYPLSTRISHTGCHIGPRGRRRAAHVAAPWQCSGGAQRPPLPPDPGPDERARSRAPRAGRTDDRPPRARIRRARRRGARAAARGLRDLGPGRRLSVVGDGRVGGGARQHALARRPRARLRDGPLRDALARARGEARPRRRLRARRLARRRRPRRRRRAAGRRRLDPRGVRRAQRDLDRRGEPRRRRARGDGPRGVGRAAARRHDLLARVARVPPRRVGRRRDDRLLAEGPDAAAGARGQRDERQGASRRAHRAFLALVLGLGADPRGQPRRRVAVHAADEPALRPARGARPAPGRGHGERRRPPRAPRRGDAPGGPGVGARARPARRARALGVIDRGLHARRPRRRRAARARPRPLRRVARRRSRQARGEGVPHRPSRRPQRRVARGRARRRRDGPCRRRRARAARRRAGGARPPRGERRRRLRGGAVSELRRRLEAELDGGVRFDAYSRHLYAQDASAYAIEPLGVCFPRSADDVAAAMAICAELDVPVLPRGGGTSLAGQCVARALVLDLSRHMRGVDIDAEARRARVQPGVIQEQLNRAAGKLGLQFGPNTSTANRATLGGMIGNNSAGSQSIKYGMTIDAVERLDVVLADATRARFEAVSEDERAARAAAGTLEGAVYRDLPGIVERHRDALRGYPRHWRQAGGYRLDRIVSEDGIFNPAKVVVGSEGTLATVVEAEVALVPVARHRVMAVGHFESTAEAIAATGDAMEQDATSVELLDRFILDLSRRKLEFRALGEILEGDPDALLFVELKGDDEDEVIARLDALVAAWAEHGHGYHTLRATDPAARAAVLEVRKSGLGLLMAASRGSLRPLPVLEGTAGAPARVH